MHRLLASLAVVGVALLVGCGEPHKSSRGFHLPDGDPESGRQAFVALKCYSCHTVAGADVPDPVVSDVAVRLGGKTNHVRTDGSLVTSIVEPSHSLAAASPPRRVAGMRLSPMGDFSEAMTVRQLIDLVAFLQSKYEVVPPELATR